MRCSLRRLPCLVSVLCSTLSPLGISGRKRRGMCRSNPHEEAACHGRPRVGRGVLAGQLSACTFVRVKHRPREGRRSAGVNDPCWAAAVESAPSAGRIGRAEPRRRSNEGASGGIRHAAHLLPCVMLQKQKWEGRGATPWQSNRCGWLRSDFGRRSCTAEARRSARSNGRSSSTSPTVPPAWQPIPRVALARTAWYRPGRGGGHV